MDELIKLAAKRFVRTTIHTVATCLVVGILSVAGGAGWADSPSDPPCPIQRQQPPTQPPPHHDIKPISRVPPDPVALVLLCGSPARDAAVPTGPDPSEEKAAIIPAPTPPRPAANVNPSVHSSVATTAAAWRYLTVPEIVATVAGLAAIAAIISLILAWNPRDGDGQIWFRRHWGGFGSASTGWGMSACLMHLLIAMAFALMATILLLAALKAGLATDGSSADSKALSAPAAPDIHRTSS